MTIADLDKERVIVEETKLNLSGQQLYNLQGIESFSSELITEIDLRNNKLKSFDVPFLFRLFPNLRKLDISYNKLERLKIGNLRDRFILRASNNNLKDLEPFLLGELCRLDLCDNNFSKETKKRLRLYEKKCSAWKHAIVLYRYYTSPVLLWYLGIVGPFTAGIGSVTGGLAGVGVDVVKSFLESKALNEQYPFGRIGLAIGALAGALIHPVYVINEYSDCYRSDDISPCCFGYNGHVMCSMYHKSSIDLEAEYRSEYYYNRGV